jgi:hypothetical protein
MEALRRYTSTLDGNLILKVPKEYRKRKLEIIIMPADNHFENDDDKNLLDIMKKMSDTAKKNGLTPEILEELLNE